MNGFHTNCALMFRHQSGNPQIDSDDIRVVPGATRGECQSITCSTSCKVAMLASPGVVIAKARRTLYSPPPSRDAELARGRDPRITRVEAQHHFAQADQVLSAVVSSV